MKTELANYLNAETDKLKAEQKILRQIDSIDCQLSPENLFCDGEISHEEGVAKSRLLFAQRKQLETNLGRSVEYKG